MLHLLQIVTCVLLMQGLYTVDALAIGGCVDRLTASLANGTDTCLAMTDNVKCVLLATNLYKTLNTDEDIWQFKRQIESGLAEKGVSCNIDVMAIVEELLEDDRKGIERTTTRPTGYNHAKTVGDCIDTFAGEIAGSVTCASMTPYLKCIFRVTKAYVHTSNSNNQESQALNQIVKDGFKKLNIECDIKLASLIEEVRREQGGGNGSSPQQGNGDSGSSPQQGNGDSGSSPQQGNVDNGSRPQQGNVDNGADMVAGSFPFVTLLILTCASVFLLH